MKATTSLPRLIQCFLKQTRRGSPRQIRVERRRPARGLPHLLVPVTKSSAS